VIQAIPTAGCRSHRASSGRAATCEFSLTVHGELPIARSIKAAG
jgi:hypothetical protein